MSPFTGVEAALKTAAEFAVSSSRGMTDCRKLEHVTWIEVWQHRGKRLSVLECGKRQYLPCSVSPFCKQKAGCQVQGLNGLDLQLETFCLHLGKWDVQIAQQIWKVSSNLIVMQARWLITCIYLFFFPPSLNLSLVLACISPLKEKLTNFLRLLTPNFSHHGRCTSRGFLHLWHFSTDMAELQIHLQ